MHANPLSRKLLLISSYFFKAKISFKYFFLMILNLIVWCGCYILLSDLTIHNNVLTKHMCRVELVICFICFVTSSVNAARYTRWWKQKINIQTHIHIILVLKYQRVCLNYGKIINLIRVCLKYVRISF